MRNLADSIESFIIKQLLEERNEAVLVQRNELADRLSCAPSQISYVLSTRFTPERGFVVESRRGSGGFVRIMRLQPQRVEVREQEPNAEELLEQWYRNRLITEREMLLLKYMADIVDVDEKQKLMILRNAMKTILTVR